MIIDDQTFQAQVNKINAGKKKPVHFKYVAEFIDDKLEIIPIHNVVSISRGSKYASAFSDYIFMEVQLFKSVYYKVLGVNRRLLKARITATPNSVLGTETAVTPGYVENYDAFLTDNTSEAVETRPGATTGDQRDDLGGLVTVHVHLVEKGLTEFLRWDVGGVYRNETVGRLIQGLMSQPLKALSATGTVGYNVTIYQPSNTEIYYQRLIPNGVHLIDLPGWIQETWGVYSTGLGYYLKQGMWWVFPLYDLTRYDNTVKTPRTRMTIINVPPNERMGVTSSYLIEGNEIYVYATGDTSHIDNSDRGLDDIGTGFRAAKAGNLLDKFDVSKGGNTTIPTARNVTPLTFEQRKGVVDNIKPVPGLFSSNIWRDSTRVAMQMGNYVNLLWENSNSSLLYPGMTVKFIYKAAGIPYALKGILLGADTKIETPLASVIDDKYKNTTNLMIFVERGTR